MRLTGAGANLECSTSTYAWQAFCCAPPLIPFQSLPNSCSSDYHPNHLHHWRMFSSWCNLPPSCYHYSKPTSFRPPLSFSFPSIPIFLLAALVATSLFDVMSLSMHNYLCCVYPFLPILYAWQYLNVNNLPSCFATYCPAVMFSFVLWLRFQWSCSYIFVKITLSFCLSHSLWGQIPPILIVFSNAILPPHTKCMCSLAIVSL